MTFSEFKASLTNEVPPASLNPLLKALWYDGKGDWDMSHNIAQDIETTEGSWIHAYLHRKEGDEGNVSYWYNRAKRKKPNASLADEWEDIVKHFLSVE